MIEELNPIIVIGFAIIIGNLVGVLLNYDGRGVSRSSTNLTTALTTLGLALVFFGMVAEMSATG